MVCVQSNTEHAMNYTWLQILFACSFLLQPSPEDWGCHMMEYILLQKTQHHTCISLHSVRNEKDVAHWRTLCWCLKCSRLAPMVKPHYHLGWIWRQLADTPLGQTVGCIQNSVTEEKCNWGEALTTQAWHHCTGWETKMKKAWPVRGTPVLNSPLPDCRSHVTSPSFSGHVHVCSTILMDCIPSNSKPNLLALP